MNLIIIDDNLNFSRSLFNYISKNNYNIRITQLVADGEEAFEAIIKLKPDIILLDLKLPKLSGSELLYSTNREFDKIIYGILIKPVRLNILINLIEDIENINIIKDKKIFVMNELKKFEFNSSTIGFKYLVECIIIAIENPKFLKNVQREIYQRVGKRYGVKAVNIKWDIEHLINTMYLLTNSKIICKYFNFMEEKKPSAKLIITFISSLYSN